MSFYKLFGGGRQVAHEESTNSSVRDGEGGAKSTDVATAGSNESHAWRRLDPSNLPVGEVLLTNNLPAVNAYGQKSHAWIGFAQNSEADSLDNGVITYGGGWGVRAYNLTHWAPIPLADDLSHHALIVQRDALKAALKEARWQFYEDRHSSMSQERFNESVAFIDAALQITEAGE